MWSCSRFIFFFFFITKNTEMDNNIQIYRMSHIPACPITALLRPTVYFLEMEIVILHELRTIESTSTDFSMSPEIFTTFFRSGHINEINDVFSFSWLSSLSLRFFELTNQNNKILRNFIVYIDDLSHYEILVTSRVGIWRPICIMAYSEETSVPQ